MVAGKVKEELQSLAIRRGASVMGVCRVGELAEAFVPEIKGAAERLPMAISVGIALQRAVLDTLDNRPNEIYKAHYRITNAQLDTIIYILAQRIADWGHDALPIPASRLLPQYPHRGHLNHREIAFKAGLGWRGKNNLLVSPLYGSRLRLATLLTDLELEPDPVHEGDCGPCRACRKHCPAEAIGERVDDFQLDKCRDKVLQFSRENNLGQAICGLCLNRCPGDKPRNHVRPGKD
ncbi:MAG: epoxyqueuosine reductase [candidate division Zixibacteria bacterium]|nr:epoxyqueuosine reductase [candidate division Zixibacteria bacterium]